MARKKKVSRKVKPSLDLNNDGKFDAKDKKIAAKALATNYENGNKDLEEIKEEPKVESKPEGRIAKVDINLTYRKGDIVPESQIKQWKINGINYQVWFE